MRYKFKPRSHSRVADFATDPAIGDLATEIGVLRTTLEDIVNTCEMPGDYAVQTSKIGDLCSRIERLVASHHLMEIKRDEVLGKTEALVLSEKFVKIISRYISDADTLRDIGDEMSAELHGGGNVSIRPVAAEDGPLYD